MRAGPCTLHIERTERSIPAAPKTLRFNNQEGSMMKHAMRLSALALGLSFAAASYADDVSFATGGYARGGQGMRTMKVMEMLDSSKDHQVTKEEFMGYYDKVFAMMDKNKDGRISVDEWLDKQRKSDGG
jgi:hypothetical protein